MFGTVNPGSMDSISDPRYVKRIDPSDGIARSLAELKQRFQGRMNDEQLKIYWERWPFFVSSGHEKKSFIAD